MESFQDDSIKKLNNKSANSCNLLCENFLESRCGYPKDSEKLNPCLENYGIGLVMSEISTLKIIIAPLRTLKYQMIWHGGLFGLILGRHNRIINLKILAELLPSIANQLRRSILKINRESLSIKLEIKEGLSQDPHNRIAEWLMFSLFDYFNEKNAKTILKFLLIKPASLFKRIINEILETIDIEVLEFITIYEKFPPLHPQLRKQILRYLKDSLLYRNLISEGENRDTIFNTFLNLINKNYSTDPDKSLAFLRRIFIQIVKNFLYINFNQLNELEIYNVITSLGPWMITKTNLSREPSIIHVNEIVGRKIF